MQLFKQSVKWSVKFLIYHCPTVNPSTHKNYWSHIETLPTRCTSVKIWLARQFYVCLSVCVCDYHTEGKDCWSELDHPWIISSAVDSCVPNFNLIYRVLVGVFLPRSGSNKPRIFFQFHSVQVDLLISSSWPFVATTSTDICPYNCALLYWRIKFTCCQRSRTSCSKTVRIWSAFAYQILQLGTTASEV